MGIGARSLWVGVLGLLLALAVPAGAQQRAAPLAFPPSPIEGSDGLGLGMAFAKPPGPGPFPALIILQTCSGATADQRDWGVRAVQHGYVALVVDSMGPRHVSPQACNLPPPVRARDAVDGREFLRKFPFVDGGRIAVAGFSAGAGGALMLSDPAVMATLGMSTVPPFAAIAAFYPACMRREGSTASDEHLVGILRGKRNAPMLFVLGGADTQGRPPECVPQFQALKDGGSDVDWVVYPGASHCFDCRSQDGDVASDILHSAAMPFHYDAKATEDAEQRLFAFLGAKLKGG